MLLLQWMVRAILEVCVGRGEAVHIFEVWGAVVVGLVSTWGREGPRYRLGCHSIRIRVQIKGGGWRGTWYQ